LISRLLEATLPSGSQIASTTASSCPAKTETHLIVVKSQTATILSSDADKIRVSESEDTDVTAAVWPCNEASNVPRSGVRIVLLPAL